MAHQENFLDNSNYWENENINLEIKCTDCFPKKMDSKVPCLPRCIFTPEGRGIPPVIASSFEDKIQVPQDQPKYFLISYGPPGSGKSDVLSVLRKNHKLDPGLSSQNTISVNVDDTFQKGPLGKEYKKVQAAIQHRGSKYTQRLYTYYRWVADQVADSILNLALLGNYNVLWETTGETITWTRREIARIRELGYIVVLVYPLVGLTELQKRLTLRAIETGQEPTPNLQMKTKVKKALENLVDFLYDIDCPEWIVKQLKLPAEAKCSPDRIILYNNQKPKGQQVIMFDSKYPDDHIENLTNGVHALINNEKFLHYFKTLRQREKITV